MLRSLAPLERTYLLAGGGAGFHIEEVDDLDCDEELVRRYGEDWMESQCIMVSDETTCPGLEPGWLICMLCHKQIAGTWSMLSHLTSKRHERYLAWHLTEGAQVSEKVPRSAPTLSAPPLPPTPPPPSNWRPLARVGPTMFQPSSWGPVSESQWTPPPLPHLVSTSRPQSSAVSPPQCSPPSSEPQRWLGPPPPPPGPPPPAPPPPPDEPFVQPELPEPPLDQPPGETPPVADPEADKVKSGSSGAALVTADYDGEEVDEATGLPDTGYLPVQVGDMLTPLAAPAPGHSRNRFACYVFAERRGGGTSSRGWVPMDHLKLKIKD